MNFLAHLFLSRHDDDLMVGNFIADSVRGSRWKSYERGVRAGIIMHRRIDHFSDHHPVFGETVALARPGFSKYAGVIVDIFYDHFLARNFSEYAGEPLELFTKRVHTLLQKREDEMPERSRFFLKYMLAKNIPVPYARIDGIAMVLNGMSRRAKFENRMNKGGEFLSGNYAVIEAQFRRFFPDIIRFVKEHGDWLEHGSEDLIGDPL